MTVSTPTISRRDLLAGSAGFVIALYLPARARAQAPDTPTELANAFVRVTPDNVVTVVSKNLEFGQGIFTGFAAIVAEEMDADWSQMKAVHSPADDAIYGNTLFGIQVTGGSTGIANSYDQLRRAGATARAMLVAAAGQQWDVPVSEISVLKGVVSHARSGRSAPFGELALAAAALPVPGEVTLKSPEEFTVIGSNLPRLDSVEKSNGSAIFTIDIYLDDMETVAVVHPPKFGATVAGFDASEALTIPGVNRAEAIPSGVAVYADNTYAAFRGRSAMSIDWDESGAETRSTTQIYDEWSAATRAADGVLAEEHGDVDAALAGSDRVFEAEFRFPYLAHAAMEPLDGVLDWTGTDAKVWVGSQLQAQDRRVIASVLGISFEDVEFNTMLAGGGFGRRAQPASDVCAELAHVARAGGPGRYKVVWTRENDIKGGFYRPLTVHRLRAGMDSEGGIVAWDNVIANQSFMFGSPFESLLQGGLDLVAVEGGIHLPYDLPSSRVIWQQMESPVPTLWWRAVGHTHTSYSKEVFLDHLLAAGGKDAVQGRLDLLKPEAERDRAVLQRVADMADWSGPSVDEGRSRGVAVHGSFGSFVAMIAEVSDVGGMPRVHKVWCAVDCGLVITPDVVRAQVEGGLGFGLGAALFNAITLAEGGEVEQHNYDDYRLLRINEMPEVEVDVLKSAEPPTGIGEPGVPPIAPAVANAWRDLTGQMQTELPFASQA